MNQSVIILASASPRRAALMRQLGLQCTVTAAAIDETPLPGEAPAACVERLARAKAHAVFDRRTGTHGVVVAADTAVVVDGCMLGKPRDRGHGIEMLRSLSGRSHEVMTAVAVKTDIEMRSATSITRVTMRCLQEEEMAAYWATGEPRDKAGGYAIQGRAAAFVSRVEGSYSGVVGLPLFETAQLLNAAGAMPIGGGA